MNSHETTAFSRWDERELTVLVGDYVRLFRRLPSPSDLMRFERARTGLRLRLLPRPGVKSSHLRLV